MSYIPKNPTEIGLKKSELILERRAYNEDATPEEIEAIKSYVKIHNDCIIYCKEVPVPSVFTIQLIFGKIATLRESLDNYGLLIDLTDVDVRPDSITRRTLNKLFKETCKDAPHVAMVTGKNRIINTALRFVLFGISLRSYTIDKTIEEAILSIEKVVNSK